MGKNERPSLGEITQRLVNLVVLRELTRRVQRWKAQDAANRRALRIVLPLVVITIVSATGYALWTIAERKHQAARLAACGEGYESARQGRHEVAVSQLTQCLSAFGQSPQDRSHAYKVRAWSQARLGRHAAAAEDQEAAFALQPAAGYRDFLDYALYLRDAGRSGESLQAILAAERLEAGRTSMMTQYHKGWILHELGRHREAIQAFSAGIPLQPSYAFAYWRRGLAYERLGEVKLAARDFEECARLLAAGKLTPPGDELLGGIRAKLRQYGLGDKYPL